MIGFLLIGVCTDSWMRAQVMVDIFHLLSVGQTLKLKATKIFLEALVAWSFENAISMTLRVVHRTGILQNYQHAMSKNTYFHICSSLNGN